MYCMVFAGILQKEAAARKRWQAMRGKKKPVDPVEDLEYTYGGYLS